VAVNEKCIVVISFGSGAIGVSIGGPVGFLLGGPVGAILGAIIGGAIGFYTGMAAAAYLCSGGEGGGGGGGGSVSFDKPRFSNLRLEAQPNPVNKDSSCRITIHWTVVNNNDRASCQIKFKIVATDGTPAESPDKTVPASSATTFSRAEAWSTKWSEESDGKPVNATVVLVATKGTETYQLQQAADQILVEVRPN
jgi:hypothetical protein